MSQIRFNRESQGFFAGDMESADVCGPEGPNALPLVMEGEFAGKAARKVICLTDVSRVPVLVDRLLTKYVHAGSLKISDADDVKLEPIDLSKSAPINRWRH